MEKICKKDEKKVERKKERKKFIWFRKKERKKIRRKKNTKDRKFKRKKKENRKAILVNELKRFNWTLSWEDKRFQTFLKRI